MGDGYDNVGRRAHAGAQPPHRYRADGRAPRHHVEQQTWTGKQNLVVKEDVWIEIEPGQTGNFLCLLSAPTQAVAAPAASP